MARLFSFIVLLSVTLLCVLTFTAARNTNPAAHSAARKRYVRAVNNINARLLSQHREQTLKAHEQDLASGHQKSRKAFHGHATAPLAVKSVAHAAAAVKPVHPKKSARNMKKRIQPDSASKS